MVRSVPPQVRVRFAPSPSGALHMGSAMVALANAAWARDHAGVLVLRIDDTDHTRSSDEDAAEVVRMLRWLGVEWQEGPYHQRDRGAAYRAALERLDREGAAYPCFCGDARLAELRAQQEAAGLPPRYDGRCRALPTTEVDGLLDDGAPHVLRLAVDPGRDVAFDDLVHGTIQVPAGAFGDPVLCRSDGRAGYLLASVVDDVEMGITHVLRGEDHLTNTARQLLLHEALGGDQPPRYAHLPLLRDSEGRKLSKRDPLGSLDELVDEGFLPVTVRRYISELLGQGPRDLLASDDQFDLARVPTGAPRVDRVRLESLGREDMSQLPLATLLAGSGIAPGELVEPIVRELATQAASRVQLRGDLRLVFDGPGQGDIPYVLAFLGEDPMPALTVIDRVLQSAAREPARPAAEQGPPTDAGWEDRLLAEVRSQAAAVGIGARGVLLPLRMALTGSPDGPALPLVLAALGVEEARMRVELFLGVASEVLATEEGGGAASAG